MLRCINYLNSIANITRVSAIPRPRTSVWLYNLVILKWLWLWGADCFLRLEVLCRFICWLSQCYNSWSQQAPTVHAGSSPMPLFQCFTINLFNLANSRLTGRTNKRGSKRDDVALPYHIFFHLFGLSNYIRCIESKNTIFVLLLMLGSTVTEASWRVLPRPLRRCS